MATKTTALINRRPKPEIVIEEEITTAPELEIPSLDDRSLYLNRELSLLAFQRRVLEEAQDESNPLLERVKFLSIVGSNLDEFFMVRVAGLKRQLESGASEVGPDGMSPAAQLEAIRTEVLELLGSAHRCIRRQLVPALERAGIHLMEYEQLTPQQKARADRYFTETVFPVLTPLAFDPGRPFPHISNLSLNLAILIRDKEGEEHFARLKVPDGLPQLVPVDRVTPNGRRSKVQKHQSFLWLEDLISANLNLLFPGMEIVEAHPFHVTRDADIEIQELEAGDLLETTEEGIRQRRFGDVVRLVVRAEMPAHILKILINNLEVDRKDVYRVKGPLSLSRYKYIAGLDRPELKDPPFLPAVPASLDLDVASEEEDLFSAIRRRDILLYHPYDSFQTVVDFLQKAARDPSVLAIKMTLYRVGRNSPIVEALLEASENEKQVAALVELKARFDEESNIEWARALERQGVHVVYGLLGLKVHSKVALVVRKEGDTIRRYVHLGTGNYNPVTAHLYTDFGLFTADHDIGADATDLFNYLTGYSAKNDYRKLLVAPINLRDRLEHLIRREIKQHLQHGNGHMSLKMNALVDTEMVRLLYEASQAGVKVDLLVRGICCLRPGVPGVSDNIRVISVVGRFLEHSRIYYFHNSGDDEVYLGSADLMPRNLNRRVEVIFPVEDRRLVRYLRDEVIETYMADNLKAREMMPDGSYRRLTPAESTDGLEREKISSQALFLSRAQASAARR
ncbi:MAG TPA: polyphosphate kinase 1 [Terriglobales bacterium]|nr:polyphosphate kinase 1 [Terriglobales bacterium]